MKCPDCAHENPPQGRFCTRCGTPLIAVPRGEAPDVGAFLSGRYRLGRIIGRGAFGVVYEAQDAMRSHRVAVKVATVMTQLSETAAERLLMRFAREVRVGKMLKHPRIVPMLDSGEYRGTPFLVMEHASGQTLEDLIERTPLTLLAAVAILKDILNALIYAHAKSIIHRDVKPANIMVDASGRARLMDFGIAKLTETLSTTLTTQGVSLGTPSYMSPEQARGDKIDKRSDLFSVGLIAYQLFTGRRAYAGRSVAVIHQILTKPLPESPGLPPPLRRWLDRACAKKRDRRFSSAEEMLRSLSVGDYGQEDPNRTREARTLELHRKGEDRPVAPESGTITSHRQEVIPSASSSPPREPTKPARQHPVTPDLAALLEMEADPLDPPSLRSSHLLPILLAFFVVLSAVGLVATSRLGFFKPHSSGEPGTAELPTVPPNPPPAATHRRTVTKPAITVPATRAQQKPTPTPAPKPPNPRLLELRRHLETRHWKEAAATAELLLGQDPGNTEARKARDLARSNLDNQQTKVLSEATARYTQGDLQAAHRLVDQCLKLDPANRAAMRLKKVIAAGIKKAGSAPLDRHRTPRTSQAESTKPKTPSPSPPSFLPVARCRLSGGGLTREGGRTVGHLALHYDLSGTSTAGTKIKLEVSVLRGGADLQIFGWSPEAVSGPRGTANIQVFPTVKPNRDIVCDEALVILKDEHGHVLAKAKTPVTWRWPR